VAEMNGLSCRGKFALRQIKALQPHIRPPCHELAIKLA